MSFEWYPWYPSLHKSDTMHLTAEQDGIYRRLLDHYMETRHPLPDNDFALSRIAGVDSNAWAIAAAILRPYFRHGKDGHLHHKRCDAILQEQDGRNKKQSEKGKKGALKRWKNVEHIQDVNSSGHSTGIAQPMPSDSTLHDMTLHNNKYNIKTAENGSGLTDKDKWDSVLGVTDFGGQLYCWPEYALTPTVFHDNLITDKYGLTEESRDSSLRKFKERAGSVMKSEQEWRSLLDLWLKRAVEWQNNNTRS